MYTADCCKCAVNSKWREENRYRSTAILVSFYNDQALHFNNLHESRRTVLKTLNPAFILTACLTVRKQHGYVPSRLL